MTDGPARDSSGAYGPLIERFARRVDPGTLVYGQGAVTREFYLVLSGRIVFEVIDSAGSRAVVHEAGPGDCFGHVGAFSGRPTSAAATAAEPTVILAVGVNEAEAAFRLAPRLALDVIEQLTTVGRARRSIREVGEDVGVPTPSEATAPVEAPTEAATTSGDAAPETSSPLTASREAPADGRIALPDPAFDERVFFADDVTCPVCDTTFEHLRVRLGAVRPTGRESDFQTRYRGTDPTLYTITVCPHCAYAAYAEEFGDVSASERQALLQGASARGGSERRNLCGVRSPDDAAESFEVALECYRSRSAGQRRLAGLLHRRAWLERSRGDEAREREFLTSAVEAYRSAYEADKTMTDASATRAAYLLGDLYLRLGALDEAGRWLEICLHGKHDAQSGILRMARERMFECRTLLEERAA
ncbi:MAG: DUF2225 domain-containing protein [Dehalococcoidia bacterium]